MEFAIEEIFSHAGSRRANAAHAVSLCFRRNRPDRRATKDTEKLPPPHTAPERLDE